MPSACGKTAAIYLISVQHANRGTGVDVISKPVLIDTDVMVDFLRGHPKAVALVRKHSSRIILSSIVTAELYAGVRGNQELDTLDNLLSLFRVVPVSPSLAKAGGLHKRDYSKAHGVRSS